jgi:hypothetical protein
MMLEWLLETLVNLERTDAQRMLLSLSQPTEQWAGGILVI